MRHFTSGPAVLAPEPRKPETDMNNTDPRAAASLALQKATTVYNAARSEALQAEDAHATAEYRVAQYALDIDAGAHNAESKHQDAYQYSVRTGAALSIANRAVVAALAERNRLYDIYLDLSAASKA
jgi:hypothetical protein